MKAIENLRLNLALPINSRLTQRKRENEEYFAKLESTRATILADCQADIQRVRAQHEEMEAIGSQIRSKEFAGYTADKKKYGRVFTTGRAESTNLAEINAPMYSVARIIENKKHGGEGSLVASWVA